MTACRIDHITVTAPSLAAGAAYVEGVLGVPLQAGGKHPRMATHNRLLRLGEAVFLEVISPNPAAPRPDRPRWFALDDLEPESLPRLAAWVARTGDIRAAVGGASEPLGNVEPMSRGALDWLITIPADGSLPLGSVAPVLIQWQAEPHPAASLPDLGLSLCRLELFHPEPKRVLALLDSIGFEGPVEVLHLAEGRGSGLVAHIETPSGLRRLSL